MRIMIAWITPLQATLSLSSCRRKQGEFASFSPIVMKKFLMSFFLLKNSCCNFSEIISIKAISHLIYVILLRMKRCSRPLGQILIKVSRSGVGLGVQRFIYLKLLICPHLIIAVCFIARMRVYRTHKMIASLKLSQPLIWNQSHLNTWTERGKALKPRSQFPLNSVWTLMNHWCRGLLDLKYILSYHDTYLELKAFHEWFKSLSSNLKIILDFFSPYILDPFHK